MSRLQTKIKKAQEQIRKNQQQIKEIQTQTKFQQFRETSTGRIIYNLGVIGMVFLFMSIGMNVFAERPGDRTNDTNPAIHYLWQMTHRHAIEDLGKQVDYQYARIYLYKRMQGNPANWGWEQKDAYDKMYAAYQEQLARYNNLIAQYNADTPAEQTGLLAKNYPVDYMPYATR
jgi:hypothetical protein